MAESMVTAEIAASVELYNLQSLKLRTREHRRLKKLEQQTTHRRKEVNGRKDISLKRKAKSSNVPRPVLNLPDAYVPPIIPPVRGLLGIIKECTVPFEKQLTTTDLKDDQSRISFSRIDAEQFLLPYLRGMDLKKGVKTTVYDMEGNAYAMMFKNWCDKYYVLTSGWKEFYKSHDLIPVEDFVTVWMFRHGVSKKLCFALSSRRCDVHQLIKKVRKS